MTTTAEEERRYNERSTVDTIHQRELASCCLASLDYALLIALVDHRRNPPNQTASLLSEQRRIPRLISIPHLFFLLRILSLRNFSYSMLAV